jgi:hypothetical protein
MVKNVMPDADDRARRMKRIYTIAFWIVAVVITALAWAGFSVRQLIGWMS